MIAVFVKMPPLLGGIDCRLTGEIFRLLALCILLLQYPTLLKMHRIIFQAKDVMIASSCVAQ